MNNIKLEGLIIVLILLILAIFSLIIVLTSKEIPYFIFF